MSRKQAIALSIVETLTEKTEGTGMPSGHMYAALGKFAQGCSIEQFQAIVGALCDAGMIRKEGHLLFA